MTGQADPNDSIHDVVIPAFPDVIGSGVTVLVACNFSPPKYAVILRALCQFSRSEDTAVIVTTTHSAHETTGTFETICPVTGRPSVGLVDTVSEQQFISAIYSEAPVVYTPRDVERLVLGLVEITGVTPPREGSRHLAIRSLTPLLLDNSTDAVCHVIDRISGLRSERGCSFFGIDYTQHEQQLLSQLTGHADYVLWVTEQEAQRLTFELEGRRTSLYR